MSAIKAQWSDKGLNYCAFSKILQEYKENVDVKSFAESGLECKNIYMTDVIYIAGWKAYVDGGMMFKLVIAFCEKFKSITPGNEVELVPNISLCNQLKYLCLLWAKETDAHWC